MRIHKVLSAAAAAMALSLASPPLAHAFDLDRPHPPQGASGEQTVRHWVYYPRYREVFYTYGQKDPYGYHYEPSGYYPYYNSGQWKPRRCMPPQHAHFKAPKYYPGWGKNKTHWDQAQWHAEHHGSHPFWDW